MPDYNLNSIVSGGENNLIEIGFDVEGYEVEYLRGPGTRVVNGAATQANGIITISPGGYIDDAAAKQQVLNWSTYGTFVVLTEEGNAATVKNNTESRFGLPDILSDSILARSF